MNTHRIEPASPGDGRAGPVEEPRHDGANAITPLEGEAGIPDVATRARQPISWKGLLAVAVLVVTMVATLVVYLQRFAGNPKNDTADQRSADRPSAALATPKRLDLPDPAAQGAGTSRGHTNTSASTGANPTPPANAEPAGLRIPALQPDAALAEPIGVRRTPSGAPQSGQPQMALPEDAPVMVLSSRPGSITGPTAGTATSADPNAQTRPARATDGVPFNTNTADPAATSADDPVTATARNLQAYQQQIQSLLKTLTQSTQLATAQPTSAAPTAAPLSGAPLGMPPGVPHPLAGPPTGAPAAPGSNLFGGQLAASNTPRVVAGHLGNRSLTLPKGTAFTCALKTKVISAVSGLVGCQVQRDVYSDNGRVLLVERGSHLDGEYRIASVKPGMVRIPVLWTRIRTPLGVTVDIDSPGTGPLGESGIDGYVDNRWAERLGAAMLLSLIDDSVRLVIQNQANESQADTIVLPSTTANTSKLAEKVLESTISIPPLIYQNQGGIVGIYVARDVDFSSVYELRPVP